MNNLRAIYAEKAISQIPRLLSNLDRNPYSPTYGCFHRDYWLDKTSDFPDAVRQFGVHALALVYKYDLPANTYKGAPKIREWAIAAMRYWAKIQHKDGSFDEFYPYERGWVGPTAFTTYTVIEAYRILQDTLSNYDRELIGKAIEKSAYFIGKGETEEDHLANHHAMACLTLSKAADLLADPALEHYYKTAWQTFLTYHNTEEGWSIEYDGTDPGYLSATVSFLSKIYKEKPDKELFNVLKASVSFSAYFVYPDGFYAGSTGSRNTMHFYPHGYEIIGNEYPLATAVADKMLTSLSEDKLVPPEIISDRYVAYRVSEFLQAYLDYSERPENLPALPYQSNNFYHYFPKARIYATKINNNYLIVNAAKGGVIKYFDCNTGNLLLNNAGIIGKINHKKTLTSQWIDPDYSCYHQENEVEIQGYMNKVPSHTLFSPFKNILFRATLIAFGWIPRFSHFLKGKIRKALILGHKKSGVKFSRKILLMSEYLYLTDKVTIEDDSRFQALSFGDEFFVRYVPQSRYFQSYELHTSGYTLSDTELETLNKTGEYTYTIKIAR